MLKKQIIIVILHLLAAALLCGCQKHTENERVAKVLTAIQKAVEQKDVNEALFHVSKTYSDPQGNDYEGIKGLLRFYFFRHRKISIILTDPEINIDVSTASARFQAILSGKAGSAGNILPDSLGAYRFDVALTTESGEWRVISAKWERFGEGSIESSE